MIDNTLAYTIIVFLGALSGTLVPYIIKVRKDPTLKFDPNYGYALLIATVIAVLGLIPDGVPEITLQVFGTAFLVGSGLQTYINKAVPQTTLPEENPGG